MAKPDLVIFDCDGMLVDSEIIAARIEAELLAAAGFEIGAEETTQSYAGLTFKDIMLKIEEKAAIRFQASLISQAEELSRPQAENRRSRYRRRARGGRNRHGSALHLFQFDQRAHRDDARSHSYPIAVQGPHLFGNENAKQEAEAIS